MPSVRFLLGLSLLAWFGTSSLTAQEPQLNVVTTLPVYGVITKQIAGDRAEVASISSGDEDAHFVKPKPSFALMLKRADLFVTTGLDLELWAPVLIDKAGNRSIRAGQSGYISASQGVPLEDIPEQADRSGGDVHVYGNPHISTSPLNVKIIAANIAEGLARIDPSSEAYYRTNLADFEREINQAIYGPRLLDVFPAETLDSMARQGTLISFLQENEYQGLPLMDRLGGWLGKGMVFRGRSIVAYHKNWHYFTELFGLDVVDYVEPKPGIPPSARHVHKLIERIETEDIEVILAASYFSTQQIGSISDRTGCKAVTVPLGPGGQGPAGYVELVDLWIENLVEAFGQ